MEIALKSFDERRRELINKEKEHRLDSNEQRILFTIGGKYAIAAATINDIRTREWDTIWSASQSREVGAPFLTCKECTTFCR